MRTLPWLVFPLILLAAGVLTSCATVDARSTINSAGNFQKYRSFDFAPLAQRFDPAVFSVINQVRVKNAIEATLKEKGLKLADNPDLLASYYFSVKNKAYDAKNPSSEGNSVRDTIQKYYGAKYSSFGSADEQGNVQYREGTLVIELADRRTNQLVYEGVTTGIVHTGRSDAEVEKRIEEAVRAALAKLPR